jgi:serine/threonine protein phosphatase PrpC
MVQIRYGSVSITGNYRENNEDNCLADPDARYFLIADGMGGQAAGEKASEMATELIPQRLDDSIDFDKGDPKKVLKSIDEAVAYANLEIMALGEVDPAYYSMGTTLAFLVSAGGSFYIGGVGDSRVYRLQNNMLEQLTTDHSLTQALVDAGTIEQENVATHRYRNVLYRYLGTKEGGNGTEARQLKPEPGDRFLLCSDGVTDGLDDEAIAQLLSENDHPQNAAEIIVKAAEDAGSKDNITAVVVFVE